MNYKRVKVTITSKNELFSTYVTLLTDVEINQLIWDQQNTKLGYNIEIELLS